jgi:hypothetical protein
VVGAILSALARGHLEGFSLDLSVFALKSTARYIGQLDGQGKLKKSMVWFELDVDSPNEIEMEKEIEFSGPMIIGFRQIDAERWTTTRYYVLDFAHSEARSFAQTKLPYKVNISFDRKKKMSEENREEEVFKDEGEFKVGDITDRNEGGVTPRDLEVRLQTLPLDEGYWLDTGIFNIG